MTSGKPRRHPVPGGTRDGERPVGGQQMWNRLYSQYFLDGDLIDQLLAKAAAGSPACVRERLFVVCAGHDLYRLDWL